MPMDGIIEHEQLGVHDQRDESGQYYFVSKC